MVVISRARDRAELITDDWDALRERLETDSGERIVALEAVEPEHGKTRETTPDAGRRAGLAGPVNRERLSETMRRSLLYPGQPFGRCLCAFHLFQTSCHAAYSDGR